MAGSPMRACKVHYSGTVQGVGFRYTTMRIAERFAVTGYVKNLRDGRVELLVEGVTGQVEGFLAAVAETMADCIRDSQVTEIPATGGYHRFEVTR